MPYTSTSTTYMLRDTPTSTMTTTTSMGTSTYMGITYTLKTTYASKFVAYTPSSMERLGGLGEYMGESLRYQPLSLCLSLELGRLYVLRALEGLYA